MPGNQTFERIQFVAVVAVLVSFFIPRRMPVVSKDQFGADAANFSRGPRSLDVAQIGEEVQRSFQALRQYRIPRTVCFQLDQIERLLPRSQQPAECIGQAESRRPGVRSDTALPRRRRSPTADGRTSRAITASRWPARMPRCRGDALRCGAYPESIAELRQEEFVGHGDAEVAPLHRLGTFVSGFQLRVHPLVVRKPGQSSVIPYPPIRLTASRIICAPVPVFHNLQAGHKTFATASFMANPPADRPSNLLAATDVLLGRLTFAAATVRLPTYLRRGRTSAPIGRGPPLAGRISFFCAPGSISSHKRAAAKPREAPASPIAQITTRRCSASCAAAGRVRSAAFQPSPARSAEASG